MRTTTSSSFPVYLILPSAPGARIVRIDHVLKDGSLIPEQVGPGQFEAGGLRESLDEAVHQVPEVHVELLLALLGDCRAKAPDDGEDEQDLEVDRVNL